MTRIMRWLIGSLLFGMLLAGCAEVQKNPAYQSVMGGTRTTNVDIFEAVTDISLRGQPSLIVLQFPSGRPDAHIEGTTKQVGESLVFTSNWLVLYERTDKERCQVFFAKGDFDTVYRAYVEDTTKHGDITQVGAYTGAVRSWFEGEEFGSPARFIAHCADLVDDIPSQHRDLLP